MLKIIDKHLTVNKFSRPGQTMSSIKGVVIHWVANKNTSADANRSFFENRKNGNSGYGSAQYIIDLNGDVVRCMPENEIAYHSGSKTYTAETLARFGKNVNLETIGIECTHIDDNGKMTNETYNSLVIMCVELCKKYKLNPLKDLWLHKEIVGWKNCHKWFVDNPNEWKKFKQLVHDKMFPKTVKENLKVEDKLTMKQLTEIEKKLRADLNIPDSSWAVKEVQTSMDNKILSSMHDPNELVTMGVLCTMLNNMVNEINKKIK